MLGVHAQHVKLLGTSVPKKGYFARISKFKPSSGFVATVFNSHVQATMTIVHYGLSQAATVVTIKGQKVSALMDSCSTDSYFK